MNAKITNELMKGAPLEGVDATRLVLECVEGLGRRAEGMPRVLLMELVRRMLQVEGVGQLPLRGMTAAQCREILLKAFGKSVHSYRKG